MNKGQFKKGHKPWNTGKSRSEETKQKISQAHKGKALTEEHKRKIGEGVKHSEKFQMAIKSKEWKEKMSKVLKGRKFSKKWCEKISNSLKGRLMGDNNPAKRFEVRQKISGALKKSWQDSNSGLHSAERTEKLRQKTLIQLKQNPIKVSSAEIQLREALAENGFNNFIPQFQIFGHYLIDIAFPKEKVAIECDGYYWHNLPERIKSDQLRDRRLKENGWIIIRIPNKNIYENINQVVAEIRLVIKAEN